MMKEVVIITMVIENGVQRFFLGKRRKNFMTAVKNSDMVIILQVLVFNLFF